MKRNLSNGNTVTFDPIPVVPFGMTVTLDDVFAGWLQHPVGCLFPCSYAIVDRGAR